MAEAWNEAGWEGVADQGLLDPQVEYHDDRKWPEARSALGPSALVRRFREVMDGWARMQASRWSKFSTLAATPW